MNTQSGQNNLRIGYLFAMEKTNAKKVQELLNDIEIIDPEKYDILMRLHIVAILNCIHKKI